MSLSMVRSCAGRGLDAVAVGVEIYIAAGMPSLDIVGLPEKVVRKNKYGVRTVISHSRFEFPFRRVTVNLAPADLLKEGAFRPAPIFAVLLWQMPCHLKCALQFAGNLATTYAFTSRGLKRVPLTTVSGPRVPSTHLGRVF